MRASLDPKWTISTWLGTSCYIKYMDSVMKETHCGYTRQSHSYIFSKCPSESCTVGGYTVPKGTKVFINVWAIHRDPKYWDNPSEFKPKRFLTNPSRWDYGGNNFQYLPFGSGRIVCPGIPLAERMLIYLLASSPRVKTLIFHSNLKLF